MDIEAVTTRNGSKPVAMRIAGQIYTKQDLPPRDTIRWVISRKTLVASAVVADLLSTEEASALYPSLSIPELNTWVEVLRTKGVAGLRITHVQELSKSVIDESLPRPVEEFYVAEADGLILYNDGEMTRGNNNVFLTPKECKLLAYLMLNPGIVISKEALLRVLYPNRAAPELKILDIFVCKIRKKIEETFGITVIETAWGRGYFVP